MSAFVRQDQLDRVRESSHAGFVWDMIVIGGGATGVGIAVDAASRDYSVLLLEQADFGKGTSSRSTKLVHGGVRYLKQGNVALVREALEERAVLLNAAPHVVHDLPFIIPCPTWWPAFFYGTGLKLYDWLAGKENLGKSRRLSRSQVLAHISTLDKRQCAHGILYHDGQFDDARLLINLAQTAVRHSACLINYARVDELTKSPGGPISGVRWTDLESGESTDSQARVVINATGPFCDAIRRMDDRQAAPMVAASQGVHLVLPKRFLPGKTAMMVPKTSDGRVVFLIPWHDAVVLGTTDTAIDSVSLEPRAQAAEIDFLLETVAGYLPDSPTRADVLSVFTGIRPLVVANPGARTSRLPRDHTINISGHGLVTITGGKWTTYRKMAEDCVNRAAEYAQLAARPCRTRSLAIAGAPADGATAFSGKWSVYGSDAALIEELSHTLPGSDEPLDSRLPITPSQIVWAVRHEMARTVEDVLARRTRALFLNAQAALDIAPRVAQIMEQELAGKSPVESGQNSQWQTQQLAEFSQTARCFLL